MSSQSKEELRQEVHTYLLVLCAPAIALFICSIAYFPSKPPRPPSRSSREERLDFVKGSLELLRNPSSWLIAIVWSVPQVGTSTQTYTLTADRSLIRSVLIVGC